MADYPDMYYTHPDKMIGASRPQQNYAMHNQLRVFQADVLQVERRFPVDLLYRGLRENTPKNVTLNSLRDLRDVLDNAPPSPHSHRFRRDLYRHMEDMRRLAEEFRVKIYTVLFEFFYDTSFIRLKDLHVTKKGPGKGQSQMQGLSPDLIMEVAEFCRQLSFNIDDLEHTVNRWLELLGESEIDPELFDNDSAHCIRPFKDCARFQNILRLFPDLLDKGRMAAVLAREWWYKAEHIRRKLAGNPASDSGVSSSSEVEAPTVASKTKTANLSSNKQPTTSRKKVTSLEDMEKPAPASEPDTQNKRSKALKQRGGKKDYNPDANEEKQPENGQSFAERQPNQSNDKSPPTRGLNQKSRAAKAGSVSDDIGLSEEETGQHGQTRNPKTSKQTKSRPGGNHRGRVQRGEASQVNAADVEDASQAATDNGREQTDENGESSLPVLQSKKLGRKMRDADKNKKNTSTDDEDKMPPIHNGGNTGGRRREPAKARSNNPKAGTGKQQVQPQDPQRRSQEAPASMRGTEDGVETQRLEPDQQRKEQEPRDYGPLSWQEKKLEKLRQKLEELIDSKETQQAALKLLVAMKDNLATEVQKYRGSYRIKVRLQARATLLMEKAHGWKEETKSLDYQHQLLSDDLRLEMKLNGSFYRYNDILKERIDYLKDRVQSERIGIEELLAELSSLKEATDQMLYYGIPPMDPDFYEYEMEFGNLSGSMPYGGYGYAGLGGSLRPFNPTRFLRDEELLLGRSLRSRYERSIWEALKRESVDSMLLMSPEDSFNYPSWASEDNAGGAAGGRKDPRGGYQGDDDLSSDSDGGEDDDGSTNETKQPEMYDPKRDDKLPSPFVPI